MARDVKGRGYNDNRQDNEQTAVPQQHRANKAHSVKTKWNPKCRRVSLALLGLQLGISSQSEDPNPSRLSITIRMSTILYQVPLLYWHRYF